MELKWRNIDVWHRPHQCSNRTFMELKWGRGLGDDTYPEF